MAIVIAGCNDSATLPMSPPPANNPAHASSCTADPAQVRSLITDAFAHATDASVWLAKWDSIVSQVNRQDLATAQAGALSLSDVILQRNRLRSLSITEDQVTSLVNQITCYVGLGASVSSSSNAWVVHVGDPTASLITKDTTSGIQFPPNAVTQNTLVAATPIAPDAISTLLDTYAAVYEYTLVPAQTLTAGTKAIIGMCPDPAALARIPAADLDALIARLVLGHQRSPNSFEVLARVPLPPEMTLNCPTSPPAGLRVGLGWRILNTLADLVLPARASATSRRRGFVGGIGGATSEFSPFGTVDPALFTSGGIGGSTSEFVRTGGASLMEPGTIDGTVGTTRTGSALAAVTLRTYLGTPVPGVRVTFATSAPAKHSPAGNAYVCGNTQLTDSTGTAAVTCLNFGTTTQYRTAYTKLSETFLLPGELSAKDANGDPVVTITPASQDWLIVTHGPSSLAVTQPPAGRTVATGNPFTADGMIPARVEIRSDLGEIVTSATNAITLSLNQNSFAGGATTMTVNAVAGVATFNTQVPTAATGYQFLAAPGSGDITSGSGNLFDVVPGSSVRLSVVGASNYGTIPPTANPVYPSPTVVVTDANNNPKPGVTVYWSPSGGNGAQVNGSTSQTSAATAANGTSSVTWLLGGGGNQLRASLNSTSGGPEVFFNGTLTTPNPNDPCEPGAVKDGFGNCYFVTPGTGPGTVLLRTLSPLFGLPDVPRCPAAVNPMLRPQGTGC